jgi:hypothetical protein
MCRRGYPERNAALYADAAVGAEQLEGDLALVVVHGHDCVDITGFGFQENRV